MASMTSRQIHNAIEIALEEVARALAAGELDRTGRYYSDSELEKRYKTTKTLLNRSRSSTRRSSPRSRV